MSLSAVWLGPLASQKEETPPSEEILGLLSEEPRSQATERNQLLPGVVWVCGTAAAWSAEGERVSPWDPE